MIEIISHFQFIMKFRRKPTDGSFTKTKSATRPFMGKMDGIINHILYGYWLLM